MRISNLALLSAVFLSASTAAQENPITDGLVLWVRPDAGVVADASGGVEQWSDQSDNNYVFVQSVEGRRPLLVADGIGGVPVLRFDGVDDFLTGGDILDEVLAGADKAITFVAVMNLTDGDNDLIMGKYSPGDNQRQFFFRLFQNRPEQVVYFTTGFQRDRSGIGLLDAVGQPRVLTFTYNGAEDGGNGLDRFGQYRDGTSNSVSLSSQGGQIGDMVNSTAHLGIGAGVNSTGTGSHSGGRFGGDIAELLLYDRLLPDEERNQVEVYLGRKYGLDVVGVSIEDEASQAYMLSPPYPNPFSSRVSLRLSLSQGQHVRVAAYDVLGREVVLVHDGPLSADEHTFSLDGASLPSGIYIMRATGNYLALSREVTLVR